MDFPLNQCLFLEFVSVLWIGISGSLLTTNSSHDCNGAFWWMSMKILIFMCLISLWGLAQLLIMYTKKTQIVDISQEFPVLLVLAACLTWESVALWKASVEEKVQCNSWIENQTIAFVFCFLMFVVLFLVKTTYNKFLFQRTVDPGFEALNSV